jgi:hypothetical protein
VWSQKNFSRKPYLAVIKESNNQPTLAKNLMGLNLGGFTFMKNYTLLYASYLVSTISSIQPLAHFVFPTS